MKKSILILTLSASFIAGTMVAGNFVFADPEDGQNNLLQMILNKLNGTVDDAIFVSGILEVQSFTCPDSDEIPLDNFSPTNLQYEETQRALQLNPFDIANQARDLNVFLGNGDITTENFVLKGVITFDDFCGDVTFPSEATISGDCGLAESATLTSEEGLSITFTGNIVCG